MNIGKKAISLIVAMMLVIGLFGACSSGSDSSKSEAGKTEPSAAASNSEAGATSGGMNAAELLDASWEDIEAQAKEEGNLVVFVLGDEPYWNQLKVNFEEEYGIKVQFLTGDKSAILNKVLSEQAGTSSMDVITLAGENSLQLISAEAIQKGVLTKIEDYDKLVPGLSARKEGVSNEEGYWVPYSINPCGMVYNTNNIETPPQTWDEFQAYIDENPGKLGFCIPEHGGTGQAMMETVIANLTVGLEPYLLDAEIDPEKYEQWDIVWDWFAKNKDKITFTTSNTDGLTRLNSGEIDMVAAWNTNLKASIETGEIFKHHEYYVPEFGLCYSGEVFSVLTNAKNPAAAMLWINWISRADSQVLMSEIIGYIPSRIDVETDTSLLALAERAKNIEWMSSVYKQQYIKDFTEKVLQ